jgi:hypothetical protein
VSYPAWLIGAGIGTIVWLTLMVFILNSQVRDLRKRLHRTSEGEPRG